MSAERARADIVAWWEVHRTEVAWRHSRDPYAILVAEVMSQQTPLSRAVPCWERWVARWPTPEDLAQASLGEVLALWQGMGYPRRARALHDAAKIIVTQGWPEDLTALPGVGEYTAAAVRCFAYEEDVLPMDVNVRRVCARRFPTGVKIPAGAGWRSGQAIIEFGQRVCRAVPRCDECPVAADCPGRARISAGDDPAPVVRRQAPYAGSFRERRGRLLRATLAGERPRVNEDSLAAASLLADGLVHEDDGHLVPPA